MSEHLPLLRLLRVHPSQEAEWVWALGRFGVILAVAIAAPLFLRGTSAFPITVSLMAFALAYSPVLLFLIARRRVSLVFGLGFGLDNVVLLIGWWFVTRASAGEPQTNDLWLILIPVVIVGVLRMGWLIGTAYLVLWLAWMSWTFVYFYGAGSYDVEQLPVRIAFTIVIVGLVMRLVSLVSKQRDAEMERLAAMERMEELKSTLLRAVAHDIRSPMTAVRAAAEMLTDENIEVSADHRRRLGAALRRGLLRLDRTVKDSLSYAELKAGSAQMHFDDLEVGALVENAVEVARAMADPRSQTIAVSGLEPSQVIRGDRPWLIQMLTNILANAAEHAPERSVIEVCVRRELQTVAIAVANYGEPLSEAEQAVVFEEYYRGTVPDRHIASSIGLGLAAAKRIAEQHGGSITVASQPDGPTTFTITLPAAEFD